MKLSSHQRVAQGGPRAAASFPPRHPRDILLKPSNASRRDVLLATTSLIAMQQLMPHSYEAQAAAPQSAYDFSANMYDKEVSFSKYKGKVMVFVNVASE